MGLLRSYRHPDRHGRRGVRPRAVRCGQLDKHHEDRCRRTAHGGLKSDDTVVAVGDNDWGQVMSETGQTSCRSLRVGTIR